MEPIFFQPLLAQFHKNMPFPRSQMGPAEVVQSDHPPGTGRQIDQMILTLNPHANPVIFEYFDLHVFVFHAVAPASFVPCRKRSSALSDALRAACPFPVISKNIFARPPRSAVAWPCLLFTNPFFSRFSSVA